MKTVLTGFETKLIILVIVLSIIRGSYNLYVAYTHRDISDYVIKITETEKFFDLFNLVQFSLSCLYLYLSVYFFVNNKIKNIIFGLVCFFMFTRALSYFVVRFATPYFPKLKGNYENYIQYNFIIANSIMVFVGLYFMKLIL